MRGEVGKPSKPINWGPAIRRAQRELKEARKLNALPKAQRDGVRIDRPAFYRTDLLPTQQAQLERLKDQRLSVLGNMQANNQPNNEKVSRTEQYANGAMTETGGSNRSTLKA